MVMLTTTLAHGSGEWVSALWPICRTAVSDEIRQHGTCFCTVAEIAARAGTSRTKVQDAIRQAARLGLLTVQERRREGQKNPPNVSGLPRMAAVASYRVQKNRPHGQRRRGFAAKGFQER